MLQKSQWKQQVGRGFEKSDAAPLSDSFWGSMSKKHIKL